MNKKADSGLSSGTVLAIFLLLTLGIVFFSGGVRAIFNITNVLKQIPATVWIFGIIIFLIISLGGKK